MSVDDSLMCSFQILKSSKKKKWFLYRNQVSAYFIHLWKDKIIVLVMKSYAFGRIQEESEKGHSLVSQYEKNRKISGLYLQLSFCI
jgi:hypothetical protein